jgi:Flp pilus assembly protein TadG
MRTATSLAFFLRAAAARIRINLDPVGNPAPGRPGFSAMRGQAIPLVAAAMTVLLGMVGLGTDMGVLWNTRLKMQAAADAAAIAGAQAELNGSTSASNEAQAAAQLDGFQNGAATTGNPNLVTVSVGDPGSSYPGGVQVTISQTQPTYFLRILPGWSSVAESASAIAMPTPTGCIYQLDPHGQFLFNGGTLASKCGIMIDSASSGSALTVNGGSLSSTAGIGVVGGDTLNCKTCVSPNPITGMRSFTDPLANLTTPSAPAKPSAPPSTCSSGQNININSPGTYNEPAGCYSSVNFNSSSATVNFNASGNYVFPNGLNTNGTVNFKGGANYYFGGGLGMNGGQIDASGNANYWFGGGINSQNSILLNGGGSYYFGNTVNINSGTFNAGGSATYYYNSGINADSNTTVDLAPAYYAGGINENGSGTAVYLRQSGLYYFNGNFIVDGGSIQSEDSSGNTTNVTLYFNSGTLTMNSYATLNLSAPTSGTYEGVLFFQNRSDSSAVYLDSNSSSNLNGILYLPDAQLTFNGAFANSYSIVVAYDITVNSSSAFNVENDYSSLSHGAPIQQVSLVQ